MALDWLLHSSGGLAARIAAGGLVFAVLAILDWKKNAAQATRWREYSFLLVVVIAALIYGIINDQITSRISWEYFYYGKGLDEVLGPTIPPDPSHLHWQAARIGMQATWTAGLLISVALLLTNNPRKDRRRLTYRNLFGYVLGVFAITAVCSGIMAMVGYLGLFTHFSSDFAEMVRHDEFRPRRFMMVFGIHLGGYVGGLIGTAIAVVCIYRQRRISDLPHEGGATPPLQRTENL